MEEIFSFLFDILDFKRNVELQAQEIFLFFLMDYKHKRKNDRREIAYRFKVQLTYALIFFSRIFSHVPLWSMILSRLSSSQECVQYVVQKY